MALPRSDDLPGGPVAVQEPAARLLRLARRADDQAGVHKQRAAAYVAEARLHGATWADVGAAFGVTRQAAHERFSAASRRRHAVSHNMAMLSDTAKTLIDTASPRRVR